MKRKPIPKSVGADVMYKSDGKCCICGNKGHDIHHLDSNPSNNSFGNLVLLCRDHHNEASVKNNIIKKLSKETIVKYRDAYYKRIESTRKIFNTNHQLKDKFSAALTAGVIIEIAKIKYQYFSCNSWEERNSVLASISQYSDFVNYDVALIGLRFLEEISIQTRFGMPNDLVSLVHTLVIDYGTLNDLTKKQKTELGLLCIEIGYNIAYDAFIKLNNFFIAQWGLSLFKFVYKYSKGNKALIEKVNSAFSELESTLNRPEEIRLKQAIALVEVFKQDLSYGSLSFPPVPIELDQILRDHEKIEY